MFDIQRDRNMHFVLGELSAYLKFEKDKDKASILSKIFSDLVSNYCALTDPMVREMIGIEEESEEINNDNLSSIC